MRKLMILTALVASISSPAYAATLKAGSPACLSEDLYSQMFDAIIAKDMDALSFLSANGCSVSDKPLHATVLGFSSWGSLAHIRVYRGKHAVEVWSGREYLEGYDPLNPSSSR